MRCARVSLGLDVDPVRGIQTRVLKRISGELQQLQKESRGIPDAQGFRGIQGYLEEAPSSSGNHNLEIPAGTSQENLQKLALARGANSTARENLPAFTSLPSSPSMEKPEAACAGGGGRWG